MILNRNFYDKASDVLAKDLLGKILTHNVNNNILKGKIVETEAYFIKNDKASHAHSRKSSKKFFEEKKPGTSYVYLNYGMYWLFNVISNNGAVLVRALEPISGLDVMIKNRKVSDIYNLSSGPGKLTIALGINNKHHELDLTKGNLSILNSNEKYSIKASKRIGISKDKNKLLRFHIRNNYFVSK